MRGVSVTGRDWRHYALVTARAWVAEKVAFGVHKVMAYSDAVAHLSLVLWSVRKWTPYLMARIYLWFQGITGNYLRYSTGDILYYIGVMGILIRILGGIFRKH